jgi:hypothetical protein
VRSYKYVCLSARYFDFTENVCYSEKGGSALQILPAAFTNPLSADNTAKQTPRAPVTRCNDPETVIRSSGLLCSVGWWLGRFGTTHQSHFQGSSSQTPLKMNPIGCREMPVADTNPRCLTSQKNGDLKYTAAESWNLTYYTKCLGLSLNHKGLVSSVKTVTGVAGVPNIILSDHCRRLPRK